MGAKGSCNSSKNLTESKEERFKKIQEINQMLQLKIEIFDELKADHLDEIIEFLRDDVFGLITKQRKKSIEKGITIIEKLAVNKNREIGNQLAQNNKLCWDYNTECKAIDVLTRFYVLLSKFSSPDYSIEKYNNYLIVSTLMKKLSRPKQQIEENSAILKYLFDSSYENQSELLFIVIEVISNNYYDLKGKEETIFSYFYNNRILDLDFLIDWKNCSPKLYNKDLQSVILYNSETDRKFKSLVKKFLGYIEECQNNLWDSEDTRSSTNSESDDSESFSSSCENSDDEDSDFSNEEEGM